MRAILQVISWIVLAIGTIAAPVLFYADKMDLDTMKTWMLVATIVWFILTPFWMNRPEPQPSAEAER